MPRLLTLDPRRPAPAALADLRRHLDRGGVVALPTDTVYGLAADARNAAAVARVFALKGRSFRNPLPLVVRDREQARALASELPADFDRLAAAFWPGPLTLVVAAGGALAPAVTAGTGTVGLRQPDLPLLRQLLAELGYPLTATSANRSGQPECRTGAAVAAQFDAPADDAELLIADGGLSPLAVPSTIVDLAHGEPRLLRPGPVEAAALEGCLGRPFRVS